MVFFIGWAACTVERRLVTGAGHNLIQAASDAASKLELLIAEKRLAVEALASAPIFRDDDITALTTYLRDLRTAYRTFQWVAVADEEGRVLAATDAAMQKRRYDHEPWFQRAMTQPGAVILEARTGREGTVTVSARVRRVDGRPDRVVAAALTVPVLVDMLDNTMRVLEGTEWFDDSHIEYQLLDGDGNLMADSSRPQDVPVNLKRAGLPSAKLVGAEGRGFVEEMHARRGAPVITGYTQVVVPHTSPGLRWGILIRVDRASVLAPVQAFLRKLMWLTMLLIVPLSALLLWLVRTLHREWDLATRESRRAAEAEATLSKRTEALHSLVVAATMLSRDRHLDELLEHLLDITRLNTRAEYAALWAPGHDTRGTRTSLVVGSEHVTRLFEQLRLERGAEGWLLPEHGAARLADLVASSDDPSRPPVLRSFLGIPLRCHGHRFGELLLANKRLENGSLEDFNDLDEQVAQTLATQAGIAIENLLLLEESRQRSRLDGMTGLLNHSASLDALSRELARAEREENSLAVLMADLDHFKRINDTYGHGIGDIVIRETAARLQEATRLYDLVGRMGGEEFLVLIPACDLTAAAEFAERLRAAISEQPIETPAGALAVTISIGATAWSPGCPMNRHGLLAKADQALYRVKARGRNAVEISPFSDSHSTRHVA